MLLLNKKYKIGTGPNEYPPGCFLTDSFIGVGGVGSISLNAQSYNIGLDVTGDSLSLSGAGITTVPGDILTIHFQTAIEIK